MVTEGSGVVSVGKICFCLARAALLIFLNVPSPLTSAQVNGPSVRERTSLIRRWRFSPTRTTWANIFLPACRVTLFQLIAEVFFRTSENDIEQQSLLRHGTGHLVFCLQAGLTWIPRMLQCQFFANQECALLHLEGLGYMSKCWQCHFHLGRKVVQSSSRSFTMNWTPASSLMILTMCRSGWLRWVIPRTTIVLTCFMYSCSTQKICSTFPQQPASGRSPLWLLLSGYLGLLYPVLVPGRCLVTKKTCT